MKIKKFYCYLIINILLIGNLFAKNNLPKWITDTSAECKNNNICAVGSGKNISLAQVDAKNNIQKYFETKVSSYFKNELSNNGNDDVLEQSIEMVEEQTEGVLKAVDIIKTYEDNSGNFYVLASLNSKKVANEIRYDIKSLDDKMLVLIKEKSFVSSKKLEEVFLKRANLNKKYLFLTNNNIPEVITYKDVIDNKKNNKKNSLNYYVNIEDSELKSLVSKLISNNGGIITSSDKSDLTIKGKLETQEEFLDVDGFKKYSVAVEISCIKNGKIVNTLYKKEVATGINFKQIYAKCMGKISTYMNDNFINLIE